MRGAARLMNELERHIQAIISRQGALSIAAFMDLALQHPEYGYYRQRDPLGLSGDFITAPEISQLFGEMIGLWCADVWRQMGSPQRFTLLELGPGRGTLLHDLLRTTAKIEGFHKAMELCLIESNVHLRDIQKSRLSPFSPRYLDTVEQLPLQPVLVVANEFFDALPIHQFELTDGSWAERLVDVHDEKLCFRLASASHSFPHVQADSRLAKSGSVLEVSPLGLHIVRDIAMHIEVHGGSALIIDYGFAEQSGQSTFQAVSKHKYVDVLESVGAVDLTAHVDFKALKQAAQKQSVYVSPIAGQGDFLRAMGVDLRAEQLKK